MKQNTMTLSLAFDEVSASSAGGAPFLIAYGLTFLVSGILSYVLPEETAALIVLFQGGVALPIAFWLERRLGWGRMAADNPLWALSMQLAVSQALALPALIVAFDLNPRSIPVIMAGLGGVHFLPMPGCIVPGFILCWPWLSLLARLGFSFFWGHLLFTLFCFM